MTGKRFKTKKEERIYKFCDLNELEDKTHKIRLWQFFWANDPIILIFFLSLIRSYIFCISRPSQFSSMRLQLSIVLVCKIQIYTPKVIFRPGNIDILYQLLVWNIFHSQFDPNMTPILVLWFLFMRTCH